MTNTPAKVSRTYAIGQAVKFKGHPYRFQNYRIDGDTKLGEPVQKYKFCPFGFSGITVTRTGDNVDAALVFPNNKLAQEFGLTALEERWTTLVYVVRFDPSDIRDGHQVLYQYAGTVAAGGWDDTSLNLTLNSVLDAVGQDIPWRTINEKECGPLPVTSNLNLQ